MKRQDNNPNKKVHYTVLLPNLEHERWFNSLPIEKQKELKEQYDYILLYGDEWYDRYLENHPEANGIPSSIVEEAQTKPIVEEVQVLPTTPVVEPSEYDFRDILSPTPELALELISEDPEFASRFLPAYEEENSDKEYIDWKGLLKRLNATKHQEMLASQYHSIMKRYYYRKLDENNNHKKSR